MDASIQLRLMTLADIPFADHLRALAGWNQTREDWERFLNLEPEGCFVAEWHGASVGTATTIIYGQELAWIGMVLVHPENRRRGIGRALLEQAIQYLRHRGVQCIKLDATPLGKTVYEGMGFKDEWTLTRWVGRDLHTRPSPSASPIRPWQANDLQHIERLDTAAFGLSRLRLIKTLTSSWYGLVFEPVPGHVAGYGLLRKGSQTYYLGPIAAETSEVALSLAAALIARYPGAAIYWDIPDENTDAVTWSQEQGFTSQRSLTRMYLGQNLCPGSARRQFGIAGPELG
jgi:GNAT superfamily N-acetyltransferase